MTIDDAIKKIQGKPAGVTARATVQYAQGQLSVGERVFAAVTANVHTHHGHYPGVVVLTDKRVFAACGLPGIHRLKSFPLEQLRSCSDKKSPMTYNISFGTETDSFHAALSASACEKFAPYMSDLKKVIATQNMIAKKP